ncbi:hypothetical protein GCM10027289_10500 [Tsukamurella serpentis]
MAVSTFGASVGPGPVHCVVLDFEDGRVVDQQVRTIDPGPYRFGRRGNMLSSGFDLLASHNERPVAASAVAVRSRRDLLSVRLGSRGAVRGAAVVRERDAILRALEERGAIARYPVADIVDVGAGGMRILTVADGAVTEERTDRAVTVDGPELHPGTAAAVADGVRSAVAGADRAPGAIVLIGAGAQHAAVRDAVADVARSAGAETVELDMPEALAATGAALLAADRKASGAAPASLVSSGIGALGAGGARLTSAVLPLVVLAVLTTAVLAASYATGIIGPTGESTEQVPASSTSELVDENVVPSTYSRVLTLSSTLAPPRTSVEAPPVAPPRHEVTPTMTTFAPPPADPTAVRTPATTTATTPTTTPAPSTPTSQPTTSAPSASSTPPSGGSSSPGGPGGSTGPASGSQSPSGASPSGGGLVPGSGPIVRDQLAPGEPARPAAPVAGSPASGAQQGVTLAPPVDSPTVTAPAR